MQDSGRSSDSSCVSLSRNSLESNARPLESPIHCGVKHSPSQGLTLSTSTPVLKKKPLTDANIQSGPVCIDRRNQCSGIQRSSSNAAAHLPAKQKSFDIDISKFFKTCCFDKLIKSLKNVLHFYNKNILKIWFCT